MGLKNRRKECKKKGNRDGLVFLSRNKGNELKWGKRREMWKYIRSGKLIKNQKRASKYIKVNGKRRGKQQRGSGNF